jgi:excisionase family DNA binding protein
MAQRLMTASEERPMATKMPVLPQLLDLAQVAERLCTTERHIRRLVAERRIPFVRVGRFIRFDPAQLAAWLEEHAEA